MLKTVHKTHNQAGYVGRVFLANPPEGKTAMELCLRVGKDVIRGNPVVYLNQGNFDDIILTDPRQNHFITELLKLINDLGNKLFPSTLINPSQQTRNQQNITLQQIEDNLERFVRTFWKEFQRRSSHTDLTSNNSWCFSEAPCESFFSIWGRITHDRQSLYYQLKM